MSSDSIGVYMDLLPFCAIWTGLVFARVDGWFDDAYLLR